MKLCPKFISRIFQQEGSLCALHCLNALLQGPYFTAVDLAMHAQNLDDEERIRMAESGVDSLEYRTFLEVRSLLFLPFAFWCLPKLVHKNFDLFCVHVFKNCF